MVGRCLGVHEDALPRPHSEYWAAIFHSIMLFVACSELPFKIHSRLICICCSVILFPVIL